MFARQARAPYICSQCLSKRHSKTSRRLYSTSTETPPPPPPSSGKAKLTTRRLISLHGVDAPKFLQGIITNNVGLEAPKGFYAAFLTAPGKVLHDCFVYSTGGSEWPGSIGGKGEEEPGYLVEVDAEEVGVLMKHLKRHKLRSKFKMRVVEEGEADVWSVWREGERWTAHGNSQEGLDGVVGLTDARAPGMGQRFVVVGGGSKIGGVLGEVEEASLEAYTIRRYLRGVPEGQKEMPRDEVLPMNCNIDIMGGIDFKKGCYLGQELTIRTHHTGVVRRRTLPVALYESGSEPPEKLEYVQSATISGLDGADIRRDDKRKRSTGKLIASVGNVGLGMCRLEQMTDLTISGEPSSFKAEDRFLVQSEDGRLQEMGVRAFVPDWMRGRIRGPKVQKRVQ